LLEIIKCFILPEKKRKAYLENYARINANISKIAYVVDVYHRRFMEANATTIRNERRHCIWQCTDTERNQRPRGGENEFKMLGCNMFNVQNTTYWSEGHSNWQAKCKHCGKRKRLATHKTKIFQNKEDAKKWIEEANSGEVPRTFVSVDGVQTEWWQ